MKVLITGSKGMLAQAVKKRFAFSPDGKENELILTDVDGLDITSKDAINDFLLMKRPDVVINCAAYTNVDAAEEHEDLATFINAIGPDNLAKICKDIDAILVHISTDYVFGGALDLGKEYDEDDQKMPESAYGRTKLAGEENIVKSGCRYYIFRTAWLYGSGPNFVRTMLKVGRSNDSVDVVNDQFGSPTNADDLADIIYQAVYKQIPFGIYNATNLGNTNWADFTRKIYEIADLGTVVNGISSEQYSDKMADRKVAKRPKNSKMSKKKLLNAGIEIPVWEDSLNKYLKKELQNEE